MYVSVRSLASVAYRMTRLKGYRFHFNFFTVDFDEEMSALHGSSLNNQADFLLKAVKTIMLLYKKSKSNLKSIILIGHSIVSFISFNIICVLFECMYFSLFFFNIDSILSYPSMHFSLSLFSGRNIGKVSPISC